MNISLSSVLLSAALLCQPVVASAASTISTSAYGITSDVKVVGTVGVTVTPKAAVSATGTPAMNVNGGLVSLKTSVDLGDLLSLRLGTGIITTGAKADNASLGVDTLNMGSSTVNDLGINLGTVLPLIGLNATTVTSVTSIKLINNIATLTGKSVLSNLALSLLGPVPIFTLGANAEVAPNFVAYDFLGVKLILNEQIATRSGNTLGLTTNALRLQLSNYAVGAKLLTGSVTVGQSHAEVFIDTLGPIPEPAVWLQMIAGFGLTGLVVRRRRTTMLLAA
ncbi:hypothetical protein GCM10011529_29050 [Polymorphobacter glacialis]|uniref:PEP-CTERM sorting domain-containing protein n=1 Tax=Sandarakinorhabdus glacialis TaxID=1614636 RepID=A0A917EBR9_9SPHN|nr:PEPxxWA-CTERM sorting domain-containing protein [Polymorphobacter glacialis]GGE20572.1 hypothetical protein GCM10011529_29050 [Polymorphobacter glacialis]